MRGQFWIFDEEEQMRGEWDEHGKERKRWKIGFLRDGLLETDMHSLNLETDVFLL